MTDTQTRFFHYVFINAHYLKITKQNYNLGFSICILNTLALCCLGGDMNIGLSSCSTAELETAQVQESSLRLIIHSHFRVHPTSHPVDKWVS